MVNPIKKLFIVFICLALVACARSPKVIDAESLSISIAEEIAELEIDASLKNIDLHTAIAIAVRNNRDLRISVMESALSQSQRDLQKFDMLPDIALKAGYSKFTELQPSTSVGVENDEGKAPDLNGSQSYTVSRDKLLKTRNVEFTWNALDFGLSYIRAGQQADRYLIAKELERKSIQNITRDIIRSYWKAQASENLLEKLNPLLKRVEDALADSQYIEELLISAPMDSLLYQKELLDVQRTLQTQQRALINSKNELATLMGLLPGEKFSLADNDTYLTNINMDIQSMEEIALLSRPELMESRYQKRISSKDTRAAMLALIPSLKFNAAYGYQSNQYLLNQDTTEYGYSVGGNLFDIFSIGAARKASKANQELVAERHLAIAMTVLSQVHLSNINYDLAIEEYDTAQRYLDVAERISKQVKNAQKVSRFGELEVIREEASLLVAELRKDLAFSEMQHSIGQIYASIGKDILPVDHQNLSIEELGNSIKANLAEWGVTYQAAVNIPLNDQNPQLLVITDPINTKQSSNKFKISKDTFNITGPGKLRYSVTQQDDSDLPRWLAFLTSDLSIVGNPPEDVSGIKLKMTVANALVSAEDNFVLRFVDEETFLANESQKAREELARMTRLSNEDEILSDEEVEAVSFETVEVEEAIEVEETLPESIEAEYEFSNVSAEELNDLLDSVDQLLEGSLDQLNEEQNSLEFNNQIFDESADANTDGEVITTNETSANVIEENNILPTKKIMQENEQLLADNKQLLSDNEQLTSEANDAKEELAQLIEENKQKELEEKAAQEALEEKLAKEAEEALENLNELVDTSIDTETNSFSAQASEVSAETDNDLSESSSNAEYAYIKIGSYTRGNSANSLMNYIYDLMGFDTRFLKYDINVEKFDKNDFSVIIGPVPMVEAKSMLEELDTQLSSENSSIVDAELTCNEEVILMCSI
jgi:outer membrane protein TolC